MHAHDFIPDENHPGWEVCRLCGTAHNTNALPREHYLDEYWGEKHGHSSLEDQRYNLECIENENGESKVTSVLKYITGNQLLEIGCAPGSLLRAARLSGQFPSFKSDVEGVEPDERYASAIMEYSDCSVIHFGFFEDIEFSHTYTTIAALDVLEHIADPQPFIQKALSLLEDGGRIVLMVPTIESARPEDWHPEHHWLFSEQYLNEWLNPITIETWLPGHCVIVVEKSLLMGFVPSDVARKIQKEASTPARNLAARDLGIQSLVFEK